MEEIEIQAKKNGALSAGGSQECCRRVLLGVIMQYKGYRYGAFHVTSIRPMSAEVLSSSAELHRFGREVHT